MKLSLHRHKIRSALGAVSILWGGSISGAGIALLCNLYLAYKLGPQGFGEFSAAFMVATIVAPLGGLGVNSFILRIFGHEGWGGLLWGRAIIMFTFLTTILAVAVMLIYASVRYVTGSNDALLLFIVAPTILGQVAISIVSSKLQLEENYRGVAAWQVSSNVARLFFLLLVGTVFELSTGFAATVYSVVSLLLTVAAIPHVIALGNSNLRLQGHGTAPANVHSKHQPSMGAVAKESWQFGLGGFLYLVYYQGPIVMLAPLSNTEDAGIYNAAYLILGACYLFPGVVFQKYLLPKLHRWTASGHSQLQAIYFNGSGVMLGIGALGGIMVALSSDFLIGLLFERKFSSAAHVVALLAICIPLRFFASSADAVLTSGARLKEKIKIQAIAATLCIVLNFILIPKFGIDAAILVTIFCEIFVTGSLHKFAYAEMYNKSKQGDIEGKL